MRLNGEIRDFVQGRINVVQNFDNINFLGKIVVHEITTQIIQHRQRPKTTLLTGSYNLYLSAAADSEALTSV